MAIFSINENTVLFLIRGLVWFVLLAGVATCSFTVKLGDRTTAQHVQRIWAAPETQDLVRGAREKAGPIMTRVKRGVEAGMREAGADRALREAGDAAADQAGELKDRAVDHAGQAARDAAADAIRRQLDRAADQN